MRKALELKGHRFDRLTVVEKDTLRSNGGHVKWVCKCACGSMISAVGKDLKRGHTKSCGCLKRDLFSKRKTTHGLSNHPLYNVWNSMKARCYNIKNTYYARYGGRGITICDRWLESISNFIEDMEEGYQKGLELDRTDNDQGYSKENCRWVTPQQNSMNRGSFKNSSSKYKGVSWNTNIGKWVAQIGKNSKQHSLGLFTCEEEAALAYNKAASDMFKTHAYLNRVS